MEQHWVHQSHLRTSLVLRSSWLTQNDSTFVCFVCIFAIVLIFLSREKEHEVQWVGKGMNRILEKLERGNNMFKKMSENF